MVAFLADIMRIQSSSGSA